MNDVWSVVIAVLLFIFGVLFGYEVSNSSVKDQCETFGAFKRNAQVYDCKERK